MSEKKFLDACLDGDVLIEEIDDFIDVWHESDSDEELHEFLGMTEKEYELWLKNDNSILKVILYSRMHGEALDSLIGNNMEDTRLAARSASSEEARTVIKWLKETGRVTNGQN